MNNEQIKAKLLTLEKDVDDFSVILSGKASKKANGIYYPEKKEIIIHNKNFQNDNQMMYTAIHEFAHHIHFCRSPVPISSKAHTIAYRTILHSLLEKAERTGVYSSIFDEHPDFIDLTGKIREELLAANGRLMKEMGALFIRAQQLCEKHGARFEDYVERVIRLPRQVATGTMKMHSLDVDPALGYENMRTIVTIGDPEKRRWAQEAFAQGKTPDMVKASLKTVDGTPEEGPLKQLLSEKKRLENTIQSLTEKLQEVEKRIADVQS